MFVSDTEDDRAVAELYAQLRQQSAGPSGPKTQEGKQRIRFNAYKHGLTGQIHIVTAEEQAAFDAHCKSICEALAPVGALEIDLAQAIAEDKWRLKRARAIESGIFAAGKQGLLGFKEIAVSEDPAQLQIDDSMIQARTWLAKNDNFMLLALYGQRINRTIERNMAELRTLRAERKEALHQAVEEAVLLAQLTKSKGETYDIAADLPSQEFVFSAGEFERLIHRKERLNEARALAEVARAHGLRTQMPAAA